MELWKRDNEKEPSLSFAPISIGSRRIEVEVERVQGRSITARLKNEKIVIRIPRALGKDAALSHADTLLGKIRKKISKDPERYLGRKIRRLAFGKSQKLTLLGKPLEIIIGNDGRQHRKIKISKEEGITRIMAPLMGTPMQQKGRSKAIGRLIATTALPELEAKIMDINSRHYHSKIGTIKIKDIYSKWGSCKVPANDLVFNFKLLFMPVEVLDYVIIHELAHTKVKCHNKRFWSIVESADPNYILHRKWLGRETDRFLIGQGF